MAYKCQNFKPGQILSAQCMNNIDEWLEYICGKEITKVSTNELGQLEITFCNGEVLNCGIVGVTVSSIEESVKDGGKNTITFSDGTKVVIRNGNKGTSGVHYGADAPPSNATIWINPNGEPTTIENWEFDLEDGSTEDKTVVVLGSNDATESNKLPLLKVKDENGNWVEIPAIKGFDPIVETSKSGKVSTIRITTSDGVKTVTVNDGFDPKVAVSKSGKVTTVKITDAEGEKTAAINDGFDPVVETTKSGKVTTVKITDAEGEKTATINDGVDITKVEQTTASSEDGGSNVMTVTLSNGNESTFTVKNGSKGRKGDTGTSVAVEKVTESSEDGGLNVVNFSDGKSVTVKNGKTGGKGDPGKSAYQYAKDGGFTGTEAEFINKLITAYLVTHPENPDNTLIPFINNDLAFLTLKGGSVTAYTTTSNDLTAETLEQGALNLSGAEKLFNGTPSVAYLMTDGSYVAVIDLVLHKTFMWSNDFYIDFGLPKFRAKNISVYVMNKNTEAAYTLKKSITNNSASYFSCKLEHDSKDSSGTTVRGFNRLRIVLSDFYQSGSSYGRRLAEIGLVNYSSAGATETLMSRGGCEGIYGNLIPHNNNSIDLGSSAKKWKNIYVQTIYQNGKEVANKEDIPSVPTKTDTWTATYEDGTVETIEVYVK